MNATTLALAKIAEFCNHIDYQTKGVKEPSPPVGTAPISGLESWRLKLTTFPSSENLKWYSRMETGKP